MATHFLAAGFLVDELQIVHQKARYLRQLLSLDTADRERLIAQWAQSGEPRSFEREVASVLDELTEASGRAYETVRTLPCEPLLYTGDGETHEIIGMLERLIATAPIGAFPERRRARV